MQLVLAGDLAMVREKYIEVIEHTKDMNINARWIYGQHPSDTLIQTYIDRKEMYLLMDGQNVAGMTAITMYQGEDYREVLWSQSLKDDEVASLHILTVVPEYQGKGVSKKMMEGAGVGLYLARNIIEQQGGSIVAKRKNGRGSIFQIMLPLWDPENSKTLTKL